MCLGYLAPESRPRCAPHAPPLEGGCETGFEQWATTVGCARAAHQAAHPEMAQTQQVEKLPPPQWVCSQTMCPGSPEHPTPQPKLATNPRPCHAAGGRRPCSQKSLAWWPCQVTPLLCSQHNTLSRCLPPLLLATTEDQDPRRQELHAVKHALAGG
jgi:hypothetical protein